MKRQAPAHSGTVSPCLMVEDIQAELEFLKKVFGAQMRQQRDPNEPSLWQVQVQLGDSILMIGRATSADAPDGGMLYVWTDDVIDAYNRAMAAGAVLISGPTETPAGVREAGFRDPQGHIWWIGEQIPKPSNAEVERRLREQRKKRL
jgi:PhnB protein